MSISPDPAPITIAPPPVVTAAGVLVLAEAAGTLVLAGTTLSTGLADSGPVGHVLAQAAYFVVLALLLAACATAIIRGRRWGRTPCLLAQVVIVAIGVWMIAPSGQFAWGIALVLAGGVTGGLLVSGPANAWINLFPPPFAPEPDR